MKQINKLLFSLLLIAFLITPIASYAISNDIVGSAQPRKELGLYVNGHLVKNDSEKKYFIKQDRTFIQLRGLSEELGYKVDYNEKTKDIKISSNENKKVVLLNVNSDTVQSGEMDIKMDVKPILIKDRTYIPIRFCVEALGKKIEWENESNSVFVGERLNANEIKELIAALKKAYPQEMKSEMNDYIILKTHEDKDYVYKDVDVEMINKDGKEVTAYQLAIGLSKNDMKTIKVFERNFFTTGDKLTILGE